MIIMQTSSIISLTPALQENRYVFYALCSDGDIYTIHINQQSTIKQKMQTDMNETEPEIISFMISFKNHSMSLIQRFSSLFTNVSSHGIQYEQNKIKIELPTVYSNIVPCYFKKNYYYLFTKYTVVLLYLNEKTNGFEDVFILDLQEVSKKRAKSFFSFSTHSTKQSSLFDIDTIVGLYQSQCISLFSMQYDEQRPYILFV